MKTKKDSAAGMFWLGVILLDVAAGVVFGLVAALIASGIVCLAFGGGYLVLRGIDEAKETKEREVKDEGQ